MVSYRIVKRIQLNIPRVFKIQPTLPCTHTHTPFSNY